jgi:hypothetical protein
MAGNRDGRHHYSLTLLYARRNPNPKLFIMFNLQ